MWNDWWRRRLREGRGRMASVAALGLLTMLFFGGCDFEVTNPGPIQDDNLDNPAAHESVVIGAMRNVMQGLGAQGSTGPFAWYGGAVVRDFHAASHTFINGIPFQIELGMLNDEWTATEGWNSTHSGRWIAESMIGRIERSLGPEADAYRPLGRFYLWAGLANRILGEHVCTAVFDGGGTEPWINHFTRAVDQFTEAARIAGAADDTETRLAAIGARAAAHLFLGNWAAAAADASAVPFDFVFQAAYSNDTRYIFAPAVGPTYRSVTMWDTFAEDYFPATGDPRVAWGTDPDEGVSVARPTWQFLLPFYYPLKWYAPRQPSELTEYNPVLSEQVVIPVNLVTGREMALVRAEALLANGDVPGAMALINQVRTTAFDVGTGQVGNYFTGEPLDPVSASNLEEAWAALKFERLVELNQEGRHFGDRKRWIVNAAPGPLHPKLYLPDHHVQEFGIPKEPPVCFPIPRSEKERNQNIPFDFVDDLIRG